MEFDNLGYIKVHRKIVQSEVFANAKLLKVWIWCLTKASHRSHWFSVDIGRGEAVVKLERGQFIFGKLKASKLLRMPPSTIRRMLSKLCHMGNLDLKADHHYSIVTVKNFTEYQGELDKVDLKVVRKRSTNGPPTVPYKNVENVENGENIQLPTEKEEVVEKSPNPPKPRTSFQEYADWFLKNISGMDPGNPDPIKRAAVSAAYSRFGRAFRDVLAFAGGDPKKAIEGTNAIGEWAQSKGLSWTIKTIADRMPDWMANPGEFNVNNAARRF